MTLSANANVDRLIDQELREFEVAAAAHVYRGALLGLSVAGYVKPFIPGDEFAGIAYAESDNSSGADAAKKVKVAVQTDFVFTLTSVSPKHAGLAVYATADNAVSLTGHPDAFVGRVVHKYEANKAVIRMKGPGEKPGPQDTGSLEIVRDFVAPLVETGAAGGGTVTNYDGLRLVSALGLGVKNVAGANGGADLEFDAQAEIAQASIETPEVFKASGGVTFEARLHLPDIADAAAFDAVWGLVDGITANSRASMDHTDATDLALFHMDGNAAAILAESDDNTTDVSPVDTTIVNVVAAGSFKDFKIIIRTDGSAEFYIDGVRVLSSTTFAVRSTAVLGAIVNAEKTADATTAKIRIVKLRVAGART